MMAHLELTNDEAQVLHDILDEAISTLKAEIWHADNRDYKEMLRAREELLKKLVQHLEAQATAAA